MTGSVSMGKPAMTGKLPSPVARFFLGLALCAGGLFPLLGAFDIGPLHARDINGPPWLGAVAGGIFVVAGILMWIGDAATRRPWLGGALMFLVLMGFASIGNWIAFGVGPRQCSGGISGMLFTSSNAAEIECRAAFGIGALLLDGILVWALGIGLCKVGMDGRLPLWIQKIGQGMLLIALAPILLLLFVVTMGRALFESFLVYRHTGRWPRNEEFIRRKKKEAESGRGGTGAEGA
jgi:hypothetical protein